MMGRPFSVDWRPEDTPEALKAAYKSERDAEIRSRIQGLWLLRSGWRLGAVADVVGVHYRTVQKWLRRYREREDWMRWYRARGVAEDSSRT